jgi:AraC-like DNA-binding protein
MGNNLERINRQMKDIILKHLPKTGSYTTSNLGGMFPYRNDVGNKIEHCFFEPFIVVIVQGQKCATVGSEKIIYAENQCLVTGVDLPVASYITNASHENPHLAVTLPVDKFLISQLLTEVPSVGVEDISFKALAICDLDEHTLDAFLRLLRLIDIPDQAKVLAPMIIREIHYRILIGPLSSRLRMICTYGTQSHQIAEAVDWLKKNYAKPLNIDDLADWVNMSSSTFRKQFKLVTTLSPLQYQKRLRLYEAHRLMLSGAHNATTVCYTVGYESPTQFNREYKRIFGEPPRTNIRKLRINIKRTD